MANKKQRKRKLNYRGIIAVIVIIAIIVAIILFATRKNSINNEEQKEENYTTQEDGTKFNTSEKLTETKTFYGYEISNIGLKEVEGEANFTAKVKNVTDKSIGKESVYIIFKTKSGEELYRMEIYIGEIKPEKSTTISSKITRSVIEAYDIEIVKK